MKKIGSICTAVAISIGILINPVSVPSASAAPVPTLSQMQIQTSALPVAVPTKKVRHKTTKTSGTRYTTSNLNVRKGSSIKHKKTATLKKNVKVKLTSKNTNGWYKVRAGKTTGWVSGKYLVSKKSASKKTASTKSKKHIGSIALARSYIKGYCPNVVLKPIGGYISRYSVTGNLIEVSEQHLKGNRTKLKHLINHECAHQLQERAAIRAGANPKKPHSVLEAMKRRSSAFGGGLSGLERQADAMAQAMTGISASRYGAYTRSTPNKKQMKNARTLVSQGK